MAVLNVAELQAILDASFPDVDVPIVVEASDESVLVCLPKSDRHGRPGDFHYRRNRKYEFGRQRRAVL